MEESASSKSQKKDSFRCKKKQNKNWEVSFPLNIFISNNFFAFTFLSLLFAHSRNFSFHFNSQLNSLHCTWKNSFFLLLFCSNTTNEIKIFSSFILYFSFCNLICLFVLQIKRKEKNCNESKYLFLFFRFVLSISFKQHNNRFEIEK